MPDPVEIECSDCGTPLALGAAGCNRCGRNLVAERAAGRALLWILAIAVLAIFAAVWSARI